MPFDKKKKKNSSNKKEVAKSLVKPEKVIKPIDHAKNKESMKKDQRRRERLIGLKTIAA